MVITFRNIEEAIMPHLTHPGQNLVHILFNLTPFNVCGPKLSSSTQKYHVKENGVVPSVYAHTYEMVLAGIKVLSLFLEDGKPCSKNDARILSIVFHDAWKYGPRGTYPHTLRNHEKQMADIFEGHKSIIRPYFETEEDYETFIVMIRYHSGRWSSDIPKHTKLTFDWNNWPSDILFIHMLDMLSTRDCFSFLNL